MAFITNITTTPVTGSFLNGKPSGVDNDQGVLRYAGNISETAKFSTYTIGEGNPVYTIVSGYGGAVGANSGGIFNSGLQVIVRAQTQIAGLSNTSLLGGDSNSANDANTPLQLDVLRTYYYKTAIRANYWNEFSGTWETAVPDNASSGAWNISAGVDNAGTMRASGVDNAANPTSTEPGELVFRDGSANPVQTGYGPRYLW